MPTVSCESTTPTKDKKTIIEKNIPKSQITETYIHQPPNQQNIIASLADIQRGCQALSRHRHNSFYGNDFSD